MPRTLPRRDTEWLAWAMVNDRPVTADKASARNHSRNTPRSSPKTCGVQTQASGTSSSSTFIVAPSFGFDVEQAMEVGAVTAFGQYVAVRAQLVVADPAVAPGDLLDAADLQALPLLDDADELRCLHHG